MAAPESVYTGQLTAENTALPTKIIKLTSNQDTTQVNKDRFYIDFFIAAESLGLTGMQGKWAGACWVGSPNYYMHNIARHGYMEITLDNRKALVFWDAGLNTLGQNVVVDLKSDFLYGGVLFTLDLIPAWYVSGQYWVRFRMASSTNWSSWVHAGSVNEGASLPGGVIRESDRFWNLSDIFPDFKVGNVYFMQSKHVNIEGEKESNEVSVTIVTAPIRMKRGSSPEEAYNSTTIYNIYTNSADLEIGGRLFEDDKMQSPVSGGYHMPDDSTSWYRVDLNGYIVERGSYVEPNQKLVYDLAVIRLDEGRTKVGDIELVRSVTSVSSVNEFWGPIIVAVGTHDGSFNNFQVYTTFQVTGGLIAPSQVIPISEFGSIDESYDLYNWGYIININGELYTRDNL